MGSQGSPVKSYDYLLKFLLVGDSDVGKGEILDSLQDGSAESPYAYSSGESLCLRSTLVSISLSRTLRIWTKALSLGLLLSLCWSPWIILIKLYFVKRHPSLWGVFLLLRLSFCPPSSVLNVTTGFCFFQLSVFVYCLKVKVTERKQVLLLWQQDLLIAQSFSAYFFCAVT